MYSWTILDFGYSNNLCFKLVMKHVLQEFGLFTCELLWHSSRFKQPSFKKNVDVNFETDIVLPILTFANFCSRLVNKDTDNSCVILWLVSIENVTFVTVTRVTYFDVLHSFQCWQHSSFFLAYVCYTIYVIHSNKECFFPFVYLRV